MSKRTLQIIACGASLSLAATLVVVGGVTSPSHAPTHLDAQPVAATGSLFSELAVDDDEVPVTLAEAAAIPIVPPTIQVSHDAEPVRLLLDFDLTQHSVDDPASIWVVVNKSRPLDPIDYAPSDLVSVRGVQVHAAAANDLEDLLRQAQSDGIRLGMRNAYRGYDRQSDIYQSNVNQIGRAASDRLSARPGHTEHQTGLAVDFGSRTQPGCDLRQCFDNTVEGQWLDENAWQFGFIHRYTSEVEHITGFSNEGWHYRYVGRDLAAHMHENGILTLEELFGLPGGSEYSAD